MLPRIPGPFTPPSAKATASSLRSTAGSPATVWRGPLDRFARARHDVGVSGQYRLRYLVAPASWTATSLRRKNGSANGGSYESSDGTPTALRPAPCTAAKSASL